ncbi:MAG: peptide chain release factor N(5)-glutamine methyltransferase [Novosphingobium sp.]
MTVGLTIREAAEALATVSDTARLDAELLMAHILGVSRSEMLLNWMKTPVPEGVARLVVRRMRGEPVAYIIGEQEFRGLTLNVTPDVLIPRGDSEVLVDAALAARPEARRVLDCGTGSGALLLAALVELPQATGIGIDSSDAALGVARGNAAALGLDGRAQMVLADWHQPGWADALGAFDLILANPPYVEDAAELDPSVRDHEPAGALFSGPEGLDDYRVLVPQLPALLAPGGAAFVEIGHTQADAVTAIARGSGLVASLHRDLANRPRVLELVQSSEIPLGKGQATA